MLIELKMIDTIEGDAIYCYEGQFFHIKFPYDKNLDSTPIPKDKLSYFSYNHKSTLKFADFQSMISYVEERYLVEKQLNNKFESIQELAIEVMMIEMFSEAEISVLSPGLEAKLFPNQYLEEDLFNSEVFIAA